MSQEHGVPQVWFNVTLSRNWERTAVGIVRTEVELARGLAEAFGAAFRTCERSGNDFQEVDREEYFRRVATLETVGGASDPASGNLSTTTESWLPNPLDKKSAIKAVGFGIWSLLPVYLRRFSFLGGSLFIRLVRNLLAKLDHPSQRLRSIVSRRKIRAASRASGNATHNLRLFGEGDVFVSVGNDWDRDFDEAIFFARKTQGIRVVRMVYDMVPYLFPHWAVPSVPKRFVSHIINLSYAADLVLCISKNTEKDFLYALQMFGTPAPRTAVVKLGDNLPIEKVREKARFGTLTGPTFIPSPFILYVSTIERRKNHEVLYRAYRRILSAKAGDKPPHLVLVGAEGWRVADFLCDLELDPLTRDFITWLPGVSDAVLHGLFESALFCVYPSLYEGWGLPISEALSHGKAIISSDAGALPEVGGDLVDYVDPWDTKGWGEAILKMANHPSALKRKERKIQASYVPNTWKGTARSVVSEIRTLLSSA